jgi:hypothetical protein
MPNDGPVIVSYQRLSERLGKVLENPQSILEAPKNPAPPGYEAFESNEPPATDEEAAALYENFSRALKILEAEQRDQNVLSAPDDQFTSLLQSYLAETSLQSGKVEAGPGGGLEAMFDERDILGWAKSLFTWVKKIRPHKWVVADATPDQIPNSLRVAILGDWGTGLYGAPSCAQSISSDPAGYGLLLHLGDVYYSGTDQEVADRFLNLWPTKANAISRACNSNHEMYTGGYAYFNLTLRKFKQKASNFALQNDNWLLVGLDSAYKEWELANDQVTWLKNLIANAGNRRVVLFSHHQPFSWKEVPNAKLQSAVGDLLTQKKIFAWYWGHEHRCMIYDRHPVWEIYGRCVGHSGYPYFIDKTDAGSIVEHGPQDSAWRRVETKNLVPGGLILEGPNPYIQKHENKYGPNGYMTLELNDSHLNEIAQMPDGSVAYHREIA